MGFLIFLAILWLLAGTRVGNFLFTVLGAAIWFGVAYVVLHS
jgi:hypothetical protein